MINHDWIQKDGYATKLLADHEALACPGTQVQLVRFDTSKTDHYHKQRTEFFYFTAGSGSVIVEGKTIPLEPGSQLLIKPNTLHRFTNDSTTQTLLEAIMFKTNSDPEDHFTRD